MGCCQSRCARHHRTRHLLARGEERFDRKAIRWHSSSCSEYKLMKKIISVSASALVLMAVALGVAGCVTSHSIQSGGAYSGDAFLYNSDNAFYSSFTIVDSFVT